MLHFSCALIAVRDMEISKQFYKELFDQQVTLDFGQNVVLSGGLPCRRALARLRVSASRRCALADGIWSCILKPTTWRRL